MEQYNPKKIEEKWQKYWEKNRINFCDLNSRKSKFYNLVMFYYPSGDKIHIGHGYNYTGADVFGRYKRMKGFNVFEPMGVDAFGLPAENYAIKTGVHPVVSTKKNIDFGRKQLKKLGLMYDWEKEIDTSSPEYYKWTQWLFGILYKAGLAYRAEAPVNWCPSCKTVLANEQVINGRCERCESEVVQKNLKQWFFKITKYADRLLKDYKKINWPEKTIIMQKNWIGKSRGAEIDFSGIKVFTTRPDTILGATFLVLSPDHPKVREFKNPKVKKYISKIRKNHDKEKTGVFSGEYVINPATKEKIPVWVADYVLMEYGTGAIMAVPDYDERDKEFAKKYNLKIKKTKLINPEKIVKKVKGKWMTNYRLRDWLISRQRYWGAPIPIIYCDKCGEVLVPEKDLPVKLPDLKDFKPTKEGESPLARAKDWVNVKCPKCKGNAKRSTETMDTFVCSSWYFLRYLSPKLKNKPFDRKLTDKWLPVDQYTGGAEHACLHLLYARFITKVLCDEKLINFDEPFSKLNHQGMILASDGTKMSKSKGTVVIPDDYIKAYGADTFRLYVLFIAPFEEGGAWNDKGIIGVYKFLKKIWFLFQNKKKFAEKTSQNLIQKLHFTLRKVGEDIENFKFNTAVSAMMEFVNTWMEKGQTLSKDDAGKFIRILAPFTPHICEEIWSSFAKATEDKEDSIFLKKWPEYDEKLVKKQTFELVIQINGKVRDKVEAEADISQKDAEKLALEREKIKKWLANKKPKVVIFIKGRLINIVV
jgi:leucyl-tRNA synthetase